MTCKRRATSGTLALLLAAAAFMLLPASASATGDYDICRWFPSKCEDPPMDPIPEPSSVALYGLGALLVSAALRRRNRG